MFFYFFKSKANSALVCKAILESKNGTIIPNQIDYIRLEIDCKTDFSVKTVSLQLIQKITWLRVDERKYKQIKINTLHKPGIFSKKIKFFKLNLFVFFKKVLIVKLAKIKYIFLIIFYYYLFHLFSYFKKKTSSKHHFYLNLMIDLILQQNFRIQ